ARTIEDVPMGFARGFGKGGRNGKKRAARFRQGAVERGKPQVVADGEADPSPWQIGRHRYFAGTVAARLAIAFALADVHVEHMNLVVAGDDVALAIDQKRAVRCP